MRVRRARGGKRIFIALGVLVLAALIGFGTWFILSGSPDRGGNSVGQPIGIVTASKLNCRTEPSPTAAVAHVALRGEELVLREDRGPWRRVGAGGADCWVSSEYVHLAGRNAPQRR